MKHTNLFNEQIANGLHTPPCCTSRSKSTRFFFLTLLLGLLTLGSTSAWAWVVRGRGLTGLTSGSGSWEGNNNYVTMIDAGNNLYYAVFQNQAARSDNEYRYKICDGWKGTEKYDSSKGNVNLVSADETQISFTLPVASDVYIFYNSSTDKTWTIALPTRISDYDSDFYIKQDLSISSGSDGRNSSFGWANGSKALHLSHKADGGFTKYTVGVVIPSTMKWRYEMPSINSKPSVSKTTVDKSGSSNPILYFMGWDGSSSSFTCLAEIPNPSRKKGWTLYEKKSGESYHSYSVADNGSVTVEGLAPGNHYFYFANANNTIHRHGVDWFGGLYVKNSECSGVTTYSNTYYHTSKIGTVSKSIPHENCYNYDNQCCYIDSTGYFTLTDGHTYDVTFTFDGGKITINAVEHSGGEEPGGGGGSSEPCETFTQGDVIYLRLGNENDGYWDYAGNEKMKATFSDGTSSQAICMEKVEDHLWSVEVPSSNLVNVTFDRYDGSCQWIWHEGGGFTKSVEDFGTNNCVYKPGYNNKNVTFETRGSGLTGCGGSGGEEPEELTGDYYVFGSGPDGSNWVTGWTKNVEAYKMTIADGVATKTFYNVSGEGLEFKIHKGETQYKNDLLLAEVAENNSHLIKKVWKNGTNIDFSISTINITHKADVTVHFDGEHIWLTAVPHPETVAGFDWYIMGSGNVGTTNSLSWDKNTQKGRGNEHKMTVQDGVATITYYNVPNNSISYKVFRGSDNYEINDFYYDASASSGIICTDQDGNDNINVSLNNQNICIHWDGTKIWTTEAAAPTATYTVTLHPNPNNVNDVTVRSSVPEGSNSSAAALNLSAFTYGAGTATWYTNEECTTPFSTVTSDMHLYAKWGVDGKYYLVGDLQTASDASTTGNWSNDLGRKLEYPGNATSGVCSFSFVAPKGKTVFEIIKDKNWGQKLNGGSYAAVLDNTNSDVTLSVEGDHISFTLDAPKLVTVSLDGKVKVTTADVAFDNSKTWRVKTSNTGWGADGNNWDWNTIMTNNGTTNATAILRNVPAGAHRFIISTETSDGEAYKYVGNNTFHALYVDTSNPSAGLTWNTNTVYLAGNVQVSGIPHETNDNYERRCKFTLANDANAINGKYDLLITFDGGSIRCDVQPKRTVTFKDGETTLSTVQVFDGGKVTAAVHNKSGYDFVKWHEEDSNTQFDFANTPITGNLDLYGEWEDKHISSVSLNESTHATWVGNSDFTLTLTKDPSDLIAKSVVWSSNNTSVATVSDGTVHVEAGAGITEETVVRITCTVTDQYDVSRSAYCDVTVSPCEMTTDNLYSMTVTGYNTYSGSSATMNGLWNESSDNDGPAEWKAYYLPFSNNSTDGSIFAYDDNGVVKVKSNKTENTSTLWYFIKAGNETFTPSFDNLEGHSVNTPVDVYYVKNKSTNRYLHRGSSEELSGDWKFAQTLTSSSIDNNNINNYKWVIIQPHSGAFYMIPLNMSKKSDGNNIYNAFHLHTCNQYNEGSFEPANYKKPYLICGRQSDNNRCHGIYNFNLNNPDVTEPNPAYIHSQMNSSYYRMKENATVRANLANGLAYGSVITVRLYADAATSVKLQTAAGDDVETIDLNADAVREFTYTVAYGSELVGETAFVIKAADNHAGIASIEVSRMHAVSPADPALTWDADLSSGVTQSALAGTFQHVASSALSVGAIHYTSSDEAVATVAANGTVTPIMAGNTIITATIEQRECYAEASITYNVTLTEPTLAELIAADAGEGITLTHDYTENIVVDKAITINGNDHSIGNLTVENSGDLTLSGALTVNDFSICAKAGNTTTPAASGQVRNATNLTVNGEAYFLYTVDPSGTVHFGWYDFTVPFRVNVMTGIAGIENEVLNEDFVNERNYAIMEHLGEKQAAGEYAYKKFRGIMEPCRLYSITLDDDYNYNTIRFQKTNDGALVAGNEVTLNSYPAGEAKHANWNGVGNGTLHHADAGVSVATIQVYQSGNKTFLPVDRGQYSLVIGSAFMVQETGTMTLNQATHSPLLAPKREASVQPTAIQIASEGKPFSDQLFISADETAGQGYTQGADVAKAGNIGNVNVPQIWTNAYNSKLCAHEAQLINGEAQYTLSLYAPANGSYTLTSKNIPEGYTLYLTQNGNRIWDLSESYVLDLSKGTATEYGLLLVENYKMPTAIENIGSQADETQKIMRNGILYILRNGKVFNAQGAVMK